MNKYLITFFLINSQCLFAQIASSSFFPGMKTINPGVSHLRDQGFISLDASRENIKKHHDSQLGGLKDGIHYDVQVDKKTLYYAGKGGKLNFELLFDQSEGVMDQQLEDSSGKIDTSTKAKATFTGGVLDLRWFGIMMGQTSYNYHYFLESGDPPNYVAHDHDWKIDYSTLKIGSAFKLGNIALGAFYLSKSSDGVVDFTYYDPDTGNKGSTEPHDIDTETKGYGVGIGYSTKDTHVEISQEKYTSQKLSVGSDFPWDIEEEPHSSRTTFVAEQKFKWFALGFRYRQIKGNFYDMEDLITAKVLYDDIGSSDSRTDTTFNISFGSKGLSYSAFYSQSKSEIEEPNPFFDNGFLYPATVESTSMGINLSYIY